MAWTHRSEDENLNEASFINFIIRFFIMIIGYAVLSVAALIALTLFLAAAIYIGTRKNVRAGTRDLTRQILRNM
jgi:hypothetical protein